MRVLFFSFFFLFTSFLAIGQDDENPVVWSKEVKQISDTEYDLILEGIIYEGWHVYSQFTAEGGALPSDFSFKGAGVDYELIGEAKESKTVKEYSDIFEVEETFFKEKAVFTQRIKLLDTKTKQIQVNLFYQVCKEVCIPADVDFTFSLDGSAISEQAITLDDKSKVLSDKLRLNLKNRVLLTQGQESISSSSSLWVLFALGFLGGLIALLTPCVFPMIPLTVSFFTKHSQKKSKGIANALLYGFFIVLIYFLLSLPFHLFDSVDSQILNTIATNVWLNLAFFAVFIFFAFSFFGYYELTLPSSWAAGMTGFGAALALPFMLFALFPAWLNSLPKSGGWMTTVKVVLGFLEIGLALKFLSNADLVGHWGILKRETFLVIWILLGLLMTLYLFGIFRFPHDGPKQKLSIGRKITGVVSAIFTIYLILGLTHMTNLKLLSGFPPPEFYSVFEQESDCPLGIDCFKDFESGLAFAKENNKPILLDFTGWACVNCRKMEENVWSEPDIYPILKNDFVLISLYVDDRKELPKEEQFNFQYNSGRVKEITNIAQKWGTFQDVNFNAVSQPFYVLLSPDLKVLNTSIQNTDADTYRKWLLEGLRNFKE